MIPILVDNPLLLLFVVASIGYFIGTIKIKGSRLGVAAILFTGLFFGAIDPRLQVPEIILVLGLSLFVYSIGLSSGPAFFASYRRNGFRDITFIASILLFSGLIAVGLYFLLGFSAASIAGIYAGSTTNTAALAGVIDLINNTAGEAESATMIQDIVVGYSFSYPMGVLGGMIAIVVLEKWLKINYAEEKHRLRKDYPVDDDLTSLSIEITNPDICDIPIRDLFKQYDWNVVFGRVFKGGKMGLTNWDTTFKEGDFVMVVGGKEEVDRVTDHIGKYSDTELSYDRKLFDVRRIFVSNPKLVGKTIASLRINEKYNAVITRIRRGDVDMLANGDTVLELGDRIRFVARRRDLKELSAYFGDSYQASSKINLFSFGLGIGLGLMLGTIKISLGPDITFQLGYAGGPLVVGLFLGALRRTGPIVWTMPYSANVTLQQLGLILLLAAIGVRSGSAFFHSMSLDGLWIFAASALISLLTAFMILFAGYKFLKMPFSILMGMVANQPAILDFGVARTKNKLPEFGFTMMFPIALISKIIIAQILFLILR
ncbi:MAG: TrkA C-terminal domain-containing protein [Bacteroidota bacterium]